MARDRKTLDPIEVMLKYVDDVNKYIENQKRVTIKSILAIQQAKDRLSAQDTKIKLLQGALERYGHHEDDCEEEPWHGKGERYCSCGFYAAMRGEIKE